MMIRDIGFIIPRFLQINLIFEEIYKYIGRNIQ